MINCIINKTSYIYKSTPKSKNLEFPFQNTYQDEYIKNTSQVKNTYLSKTPLAFPSKKGNSASMKKLTTVNLKNYNSSNFQCISKHAMIKDLTSKIKKYNNFSPNQQQCHNKNVLMIIVIKYKERKTELNISQRTVVYLSITTLMFSVICVCSSGVTTSSWDNLTPISSNASETVGFVTYIFFVSPSAESSIDEP